MRLIAVGDIHGCVQQLDALMRKFVPRQDDRFVFLGDYIDRGPDSRGVIDYLIQFREKFPHTVFLQGNHERLMLDAMTESGIDTGVPLLTSISPAWDRETDWAQGENKNRMIWMQNRGDTALSSYGDCGLSEIPPEHVTFLASMTLWHKRDNCLFVHASFSTAKPIDQLDPFVLLWQRQGFWMYSQNRDLRVVHGHTPLGDPVFSGKEISLDTGAGHGGPLTACDVLSGQIWQT